MMDYLKLLREKENVLSILDERLKESTENIEIEKESVNKIQRLFRGAVSRDGLSKKRFAAGEIQRVFRGVLGRERSRQAALEKSSDRYKSFLQYLCVQIQRTFRGFYSRRYKHDQAKRKNYCRMIEDTNNQILQRMQEYASEQSQYIEDEARRKRLEEFRHLASNLNHLLSTKQIRGVYNPRLQLLEAPTLNNRPVEEHIRAVVKDLLKNKKLKTGFHRQLVPDNNGTLKIPYKGLKYRLSIQASAPYESVEDAARREKNTHKHILQQMHATQSNKQNNKNIDFFAGGRTKAIDQSAIPLHAANEPYLDSYQNPMLVRGVPKNTQQMLLSNYLHTPLFVHEHKQTKSKVVERKIHSTLRTLSDNSNTVGQQPASASAGQTQGVSVTSVVNTKTIRDANDLYTSSHSNFNEQTGNGNYALKTALVSSSRPFVSRVGGNKSSALSNDVFDVIAEANETGGAIQRHLGVRTTRFGLPAAADARDLNTLTNTLNVQSRVHGVDGEVLATQTNLQNILKDEHRVNQGSIFTASAGLRLADNNSLHHTYTQTQGGSGTQYDIQLLSQSIQILDSPDALGHERTALDINSNMNSVTSHGEENHVAPPSKPIRGSAKIRSTQTRVRTFTGKLRPTTIKEQDLQLKNKGVGFSPSNSITSNSLVSNTMMNAGMGIISTGYQQQFHGYDDLSSDED